MPTVEFSLKSAKYPESRFVFFFFFSHGNVQSLKNLGLVNYFFPAQGANEANTNMILPVSVMP